MIRPTELNLRCYGTCGRLSLQGLRNRQGGKASSTAALDCCLMALANAPLDLGHELVIGELGDVLGCERFTEADMNHRGRW